VQVLDVVLAVKAVVVVVVVVVVVSYVRAKGEQYVGIFVWKQTHETISFSTNGAASRQSESRASGVVGSLGTARALFLHTSHDLWILNFLEHFNFFENLHRLVGLNP
jgi:hypothetical protein